MEDLNQDLNSFIQSPTQNIVDVEIESPNTRRSPLHRSLSAGDFDKTHKEIKKLNREAPRIESSGSLLSPLEKQQTEKAPPSVLRKRNTMVTPTRFVDIVPSDILSTLTSKEIRRQEIIFEIINTERQYVRDLTLLIENFMNPIREREIISQADVNTIFSNIEDIRTVNSALVADFEERKKQGLIIEMIGDVFINNVKKMEPYTIYCSNQRIGTTTLHELEKSNNNLKKFLFTNPKKAVCRGLSISDFLILPLQRLCKYPLLISNLLECTEESHMDYKNLETAQVAIKKLVSKVNEKTKQVENYEKVLQIQKKYFSANPKVDLLSSKRAFIREGTVLIQEKPSIIILFDDSVLIFRQKSPKVDYHIPLTQLALGVISQSSFDLISGDGKQVQLAFKDKNEAERWRSVILRNQQLHDKKKKSREIGLSDSSDLSEPEREAEMRSDRDSDRESDMDKEIIKYSSSSSSSLSSSSSSSSRLTFLDKKQKSLVINQQPRKHSNIVFELDDSKAKNKEKGKEEGGGGSRRNKRNMSDYRLNSNMNSSHHHLEINRDSAVDAIQSLSCSDQKEIFKVIKDRIAHVKQTIEKMSEKEKVNELFKLLVDEITASAELKLIISHERKIKENEGQNGEKEKKEAGGKVMMETQVEENEGVERGRARSNTARSSRDSARPPVFIKPFDLPLKLTELPKAESAGKLPSGSKSARSNSISHSKALQFTPSKSPEVNDEKTSKKKVEITSLNNFNEEDEEQTPVKKKKKVHSLSARGKRRDVLIHHFDFSPDANVAPSTEPVTSSDYLKLQNKLEELLKENEKLKSKLLSVQTATKKYELKIAAICT